MGAAPRGGQERALEVEPERLGAIGGASGSQPRTRSANATRSGSGAVTAVGRNEVTPRPQQRAGHPVECGAVAHRVVAAPAVDMDVDEARRDVRAVRAPPAPPSMATATIRPSSISIRPSTTRSSRTSRPATPAGRLSVIGRRRAIRPRRRSGRRARSDRPGSAIRSTRSPAVAVHDDPPLDEQRIADPHRQQVGVIRRGRRGRDRARPAPHDDPGPAQGLVQRARAEVGAHHGIGAGDR